VSCIGLSRPRRRRARYGCFDQLVQMFHVGHIKSQSRGRSRIEGNCLIRCESDE
jgi:hypothetical protein